MADPSETTQVSGGHTDVETTELLGAVRALSAQVRGLQSELQALRSQTRSLPTEGGDTPGWEERRPAVRDGPQWVRALDSPSSRRQAVPRLFLEIVFLVAVATMAAIAGLDAPVIAAVMVGAWALVAVAEWMSARAATLRDEALGGLAAGPGSTFGEDPSWFAPPVERTVLEVVEGGDDAVTKLPPPPTE